MDVSFAIDNIFAYLTKDNALVLKRAGFADIPIVSFIVDIFSRFEAGGVWTPTDFDVWSQVELFEGVQYTLNGVVYVVTEKVETRNSGESLTWRSRLSKLQ